MMTKRRINRLFIVISILMLCVSLTMVSANAYAFHNIDDISDDIYADIERTDIDDIESVGNSSCLPSTINTSSNEELLFGFLDRLANPKQESIVRKFLKRAAADKLDGNDRVVYDYFNEEINRIASGDRTSTIFEIPIELLGINQEYWTAEDLGTNGLTEGGEISPEVLRVFWDKYGFDLDTVVKSLLVDNAYDLFWYDKTKETTSSGYNLGIIYNDEFPGGAVFTDTITITVSFPVAEDYAASNYEVDHQIIDVLPDVAAKANEIVTEYSTKTDYEKLKGYCDSICNLVSYNYEAASGTMNYGNPWQIIWVFDNDNSTNVVCEGYAKAFQFLCELTNFTNEVSCLTVTGKMDSEDHMWNVVSMEDKNYLVDVTNSDEGTSGEGYKLFLAKQIAGDVPEYIYSVGDRCISYTYDDYITNIYSYEELCIATSDEETDYELTYEFSDGEATITGYTGVPVNVVIPESISGYKVTVIGEAAFTNCKSLRTITIPSTIERIEGVLVNMDFYGIEVTGAFLNCKNLSKVIIPDNSKLEYLAPGSFAQTGSFSIDLPDSVTTIGPGAFLKSEINEIALPNNIDTIEDYTFIECKELRRLKLPNNCKAIKYRSFESCISLEEIIIPASVQQLGDSAFMICENARTLVFEDGIELKSIGSAAFADCKSLTSLQLPSGLEYIHEGAFCNCSGITGKITIPDGVVEIDNSGFSGCANVQELELPNSLVKLGKDCFVGLSIESIVLPDSLKTIGERCLSDCTNLTSVILPKGIEEIPAYMFFNCAFESFVLPESVTTIKNRAFYSNDYLTQFSMGSNVKIIEDEAFAYCELLKEIIIPDSIESIGQDAFYVCNYTEEDGYGEIILISDNPLVKKYVEDNKDEAYEQLVFRCKSHTEELIPTMEPTCTETGLTEGKKCSVCNEILVAQEEIPALGHNYEEVEGTAEAATCETAGKEADKKCSRCDSTITGNVIEALGHDWGDWTVFKKATCTEAGVETRVCRNDINHVESRNIEATGHEEVVLEAKAAACTETGLTEGKKCSVCNEILVAQEEIPALGHDYKTVEGTAVASTCETDGKEADKKCSRCDSTITGKTIEALGHDWGAWTVIKEATEEEEGLERRICGRDDSHIEERAIPKLNHVHELVETEALAATCTEAGNIEYWTCSKCGRFYSDENAENEISEAETKIKALGHKEVVLEAKVATCTEKGLTEGKKCSVCGEIIVAQEEIPALGHDYKTVGGTAVAATCEAAGKEADKKCSRCDSTITGKTIEAIGHDWGEWTVTKAAACTEDGTEQRVCSHDDSHVETRAIKAAGHKEVVLEAKAAACTEPGLTEGKKCSVCGEILVAQEEIPALGHDYKTVEGTAVAATCETSGKEADKKCSRCDSTITGKTIEALGHDWSEWEVVKEATEEEEGLEVRTCENDPSHKEERAIPKLNHVHELVRTAAVDATCTEAGNIEYWTCSKCHKLYSDKNAENEITEAETIVKAKGHTEEDLPAVAATCTEKGKTVGKKCSVCGEILVAQEEIPALGHNYEVVEGTAVAATCETAGKEADKKCSRCDSTITGKTIEALGHDYKTVEGSAVAATCEKVGKEADKKCSRCDSTITGKTIEALGHDYKTVEGTAVAATCEAAGKEADQRCSRCDSLIVGLTIEALGHDWDEWVIIKEATEDEEGLEQRVCRRDDSHVEKRVINKLSHVHKLEKIAAVKATCDKDGNIEYWTCRKCGKFFADSNAMLEITEEETLIKAIGHDWTDGMITKEPAAGKEGEMTYTCSICGQTYGEPIPALAEEQSEAYEAVDAAEIGRASCRERV